MYYAPKLNPQLMKMIFFFKIIISVIQSLIVFDTQKSRDASNEIERNLIQFYSKNKLNTLEY